MEVTYRWKKESYTISYYIDNVSFYIGLAGINNEDKTIRKEETSTTNYDSQPNIKN